MAKSKIKLYNYFLQLVVDTHCFQYVRIFYFYLAQWNIGLVFDTSALKIKQQDTLSLDITFSQKIQKESQKQEKQIKISYNWYPQTTTIHTQRKWCHAINIFCLLG